VNELVLRHFFEGHATATELDADVTGTQVREGPLGGPYVFRYNVLPMQGEFALQSEHLLALLNANADGVLRTEHLETICSWLESAFERFPRDADTPDGARVADVLFWIGTPEINYPLVPSTLKKMRHYLATGENTLTVADPKVRS
jgi:hypothetical protein